MENKIAFAISAIFHPIFMPLYSIVMLFNFDFYIAHILTPQAKWTIIGLLFTLTIVTPIFLIYMYQRFGIIESYRLDKREDRPLPFLTIGSLYYVAFYLLKNINLPAIIYLVLLSATILVLIAFVINFFWKISVHMLSVGSIVGMLISFSIAYQINILLIILIAILISGIVGWARLTMNAHTNLQVYTGFFLGLTFMLTLFLAL